MPSLQKTIREAQVRNERDLLNSIKKTNRSGKLWRNEDRLSLAWWNALNRLRAKGLVKYRRRPYFGGYAATALDTRRCY